MAFENGQISRLSRARDIDLDLDLGSGHTAYRHASLSWTSTYIPNFIKMEELFCGRTDGRTDGNLRPTVLGRLAGVDLKKADKKITRWRTLTVANRKVFSFSLL